MAVRLNYSTIHESHRPVCHNLLLGGCVQHCDRWRAPMCLDDASHTWDKPVALSSQLLSSLNQHYIWISYYGQFTIRKFAYGRALAYQGPQCHSDAVLILNSHNHSNYNTSCLCCVRHWSICLTCINSFNPQWSWYQFLCFKKEETEEWSNNLPNIPQLVGVGSRAEIATQAARPQSPGIK